MSKDDPMNPQIPVRGERPAPQDSAARSGEGAETALQAMLRKRKMQADATDPTEAQPPAVPGR